MAGPRYWMALLKSIWRRNTGLKSCAPHRSPTCVPFGTMFEIEIRA